MFRHRYLFVAARSIHIVTTATLLLSLAGARPAAAERGIASWYGAWHHGKRTASGARFDMDAMTAASRTLPLGTRAEVRDLATGRSVVVLINDRGPYVGRRIIDLSRAAAQALGTLHRGVAMVEVRALPTRR